MGTLFNVRDYNNFRQATVCGFGYCTDFYIVFTVNVFSSVSFAGSPSRALFLNANGREKKNIYILDTTALSSSLLAYINLYRNTYTYIIRESMKSFEWMVKSFD